MSTVRIQVRRGTAADWTAANPTLAAGEVGYDTTSGKMKVGDGSTAWNTLAYVSSDAPAISEIAQDAVYNALTLGSGLAKSYDDAGNTISVNIDSAFVTTLTGTQTLLNKTLTSPVISTPTGITKSDIGLGNVNNTSDVNKPVSTAQAAAIAVVNDAIQNTAMDYVGDHTTGGNGITTAYNSTTNALVITANVAAQNGVQKNTDNTGLITFSLSDNITISGAMTSNSLTTGNLSATAITGSSLNLSGDLNVGGTLNHVNSNNLSVVDSIIYMAADNATNVVDLGVVGSYTENSTYKHTGLVRDSSENTWKLFTGVAAEPTTTVNFAGAVYDNLLLGNLEATSANIGNVSNSELQHLDGVTSPIQTQINTKLSSSTASSTYAPIIGATLTGTVTLPNTTSIGTVSSTEIGYVDGVTSPIQTQIDSKAPKDSPTFTGTVTLPADSISQTHLNDNSVGTNEIIAESITTAKIANLAITSEKISTASVTDAKLAGSIGWNKLSISQTVSDVELGYVDGVTSAIQTQLDAKAPSSTVTSHTSATTNVHGIADTTALALTATVDSGLALKANLASPTFTGTVSGITKTMVGLGNVDNTADTAKPISTATQTALDLKLASATAATTYAPIASPTFTGIVSGITKTMVGLGNVDNTADADKPVSSAATTALALKAPLASPTFTGTVTIPAGASISGFAPLASPALTGTPTAPTAVAGTNTTQVATTAFVGTAVSNLVASAPAALDTLNELATALGNDAAFSTTITTSIGLKAPLASPTFTGTVTIPAGASIVGFAPLASPTFTGTVSGITKTMVGLGNVDNTADTAKPISTATQTALDLKLASATAATTYAPLASPTFTGTNTVAALTVSGSGLITASSAGIAFTDGTQTKEGVPSRTSIIQKTAAYTLSALTERDSLVEVSSATAVTVTIPANATTAYPVGTSIDILQTGAGQVTVAGAAGVTVNATPGLKLRTQWSGATLFKRATDTWVLYGDLSA